MAAVASCCLPDLWAWITGLPPTTQWKTDLQSINICSSKSNKISLKFSVKRNPNSDPFVVFSLLADFQYPVYLWSSNSCRVDNRSYSVSKDTMKDLFFSFIKQVLQYGPKKTSHLVLPSYLSTAHEQKYFPQMLNLAFASLLLCVCVYEAPSEIRSNCIQTVQKHLSNSKKSQESLKLLVQLMGSNLEEQWMRSIHLALTNTVGSDHAWLRPDQARRFLKGNDPSSPYQPFSYSISSAGLWKVQLYSPIVATRVQNSSTRNVDDERLLFSLKHQHLEAVFQLSYSVNYKNQNWIEIVVAIDNVRCDIVPLVSDYLMAERGFGVQEKHFPSRISLQLNPILQNHVLSVSVSKSSDNPTIELGTEKNIEGGFDAPGTYFGLKVSTVDTISMSVKPWKFEQTVDGDTGNLSWVLYEINDLKEISSSRPSKISFLNPRAWFKDRYSTACRAFTRQGGVVFARDEYGDCIAWKVKREAMGTTMNWEIKGSIWFTYLPNKHNTFYSETRSVDFTEVLQLPL
ncbi:hypothetical protein EJ110_NYTH00511 [Nymphaea thermarum]|nr:hypothetical protein EJ110_NYTH00511 [Nymphaea thermarum]